MVSGKSYHYRLHLERPLPSNAASTRISNALPKIFVL